MNTNEITEFLEEIRVKQQLEIDEKFRPRYRSNTWLKQKDLHPTERILMQLIDELMINNEVFYAKHLANLTGLSRKCVRENLAKLANRKLVKQVTGTHKWEPIKIY